MILSFKDRATEDIFNGENSPAARRALPVRLFAVAAGNCLEALAGDRRGQHSIRINQKYRICF